jgi:DNA-binding MarR family transcriptional regulator
MTEETGLAGGGPALFRLVRFWSRRWAADAARAGAARAGASLAGRAGAGGPDQVGHVLVLEAIDAALAAGSGAIGEVARQLGLDRSNASRMLAEAVAAGLVTKTVSPQDARRTQLGITPAGRELLAAARAWQDDAFARLVTGWPAADARRLAGYLQRLAAESADSPEAQSAQSAQSAGSPARSTETGGRS